MSMDKVCNCIIVLTYTIRFKWSKVHLVCVYDAYVKFEYDITIKIAVRLCENKV